MSAKRLIAIQIAVLAIFGVVAFCAIGWIFDKPVRQIPFELEGWNSPLYDSDGFNDIRLQMVDDLLTQYDFHGWQVEDVEKLLGKPHTVRSENQTRVVTYDLRDGLKLLIFEIDQTGRVIDYYVRRD